MIDQDRENSIHRLVEYVEENKEKFYRLSYGYLKDEQLALDTIQDAIVKAISKMHTLKNPDYLKTWFYRIIINECLNQLKRKKKIEEINIEQYDISFEEQEMSDAIDVYRKIDQLKPELKTIIILRFFEDMKLEEIVKITHTNLSTVKSRLYKALKQLKGKIEEEDYEKIG